jgi:basic membrane protein A
MDVCEKLADEFPSVVFAHATGYKHNNRNFTNYSIRFYQARYLSGIVAGMKTKTNKIGYVAAKGKDSSEVTSGINAFAIGVEEVNPDAQIYVQVTHNWFDPMGETIATNLLIAGGCDIISSHTNTPAAQIAAERAGVWAIGYNSDMSLVAPDAVITSVVLHWSVYYIRLVESVMDGTFNAEPTFYGIREGAVDITPLSTTLAEPGSQAVVLAARQRIIHGNYNVFDGVLETNSGKTVGETGKTLSDEVILSGINWYYRNVIE